MNLQLINIYYYNMYFARCLNIFKSDHGLLVAMTSYYFACIFRCILLFCMHLINFGTPSESESLSVGILVKWIARCLNIFKSDHGLLVATTSYYFACIFRCILLFCLHLINFGPPWESESLSVATLVKWISIS